jgi:hypothetical protein
MRTIVILILLYFISSIAEAQEIIEFYNNARYLGMGDTMIAVANDETALAANPAALGRVRDFYGTFLDPEFELNKGAEEIYRAKAYTEHFRPQAIVPTVTNLPETYYSARTQFMPSFVARNFGIGLLYKQQIHAESDAAGTAVDTFYREDVALLLGYNLRLWGGRIKIGFTGKVISRIEMKEPALDPTIDLSISGLGGTGQVKEGTAVGIDAGLILTAPWKMLPTITAVVRDVGATKFDKANNVRLSSATSNPDQVNQDIDVGVSISPIHKNKLRSVWALEYRGLVSGASETDKAKLMHAGVELNYSDLFFLRFGYNQRYWTGGLELATEKFQFQLATYGEEIGISGSTERQDRRYVAKFAFRF